MTQKVLALKQFNAAIKDTIGDVNDLGKIAHQEMVRAVYSNIVRNNPILTGYSRRNWIFSINLKDTSPVNILSDASVTNQPPTPAELSRLNDLLAAIQRLPLGQLAYIQNNADYIQVLETGTSTKAPQGIVELAIFQALAGVKIRVLKKAKAK